MFGGSRAGPALHRVAVWSLLLFVAIVGVEHVLVPGLDPARHMVSEYTNARAGWLMVAGFLAWAASLAATATLATSAVRSSRRRLVHTVVAAVLFIAAAGMLVTASFATQTSAGVLPPGVRLSMSGRLHDLGSGLTTLALFAAVIASLRAIPTPTYRVQALVIVLVAGVSDAALLAVGPSVGGIRERILILCGCGWQLAFLAALRHPRDCLQRADTEAKPYCVSGVVSSGVSGPLGAPGVCGVRRGIGV
jgi:hypothetical protein